MRQSRNAEKTRTPLTTSRTSKTGSPITPFKRILVPFGSLQESEALEALARFLVSAFGSEVVLVATDEAGSVFSCRSALRATADELRRSGAQRVRIHAVSGTQAHAIENAALQSRATVVLLGEDSDSRSGTAWFGTLAQRLLRRLDIPLLIARATGSSALTRILCAVDFTDSSKATLGVAAQLASTLQSSLTVLHVVPAAVYPFDEHPLWTFGAPKSSPLSVLADRGVETAPVVPLPLAALEERRSALASLLATADLRGVDSRMEVRVGSVPAEILACARERRSHLIVVGTGTRENPATVYTPNVAETLAEIADLPVLLVPGYLPRPHAPRFSRNTQQQLESGTPK